MGNIELMNEYDIRKLIMKIILMGKEVLLTPQHLAMARKFLFENETSQ